MNEQLTGLQMAVRLLAQIGDEQSDAAIAAVHDLAEEHAQRLALQQHAADQAQRIADLEFDVEAHKSVADMHKRATANLAQYMQRLFDAGKHQMDPWSFYGDAAVLHMQAQTKRIADLETKCVTLKELHDAAADQRDELLVALHGIGKALGIPEGDRSPYSVTCGVLERVNRLAEIEAQEPVATAWMKGGAMVNAFNRPPAAKFDYDGYWTSKGYSESPLYARPVPAQAVPESVDGLVSVFSYDEVLTFTFRAESDADKFMARFEPTVDSASREHKA